MGNKKFLLSTGKVIEVPGYMENREGYLFNNNTKLPEGLPGDKVKVKDKYHDNSGILEDYTDAQIIKFIGEPGIIVSADSVHSGAVRIIAHNTEIIKEFSDTEIPNEYGETWIKSENGEKLIKNLLENTVNLKMIMVAEDKNLDYYISRICSVHICKNNLEFYLNELIETFKNVDWWIIELKNYCPDDAFDIIIGIKIK